MDPERWKRVEEIYHAVLCEPPERRAAELAIACSDDPALLHELESLLAIRDDAGDFLSASMRGQIVAQAVDPALPAAGEMIGSYRILAEAGAGAMGHVYRALDTRLERIVALKIPPALFRDTECVARFRIEAKAASALNHPNIVTIYEIGEAAGIMFIAAEWIEGVTLREQMRSGPLPLEATLDIALQCAAALGAAHRARIIHRDIKPENIMIRSDALVKLVDFGLARMSGADNGSPGLSRGGIVMGTPRYMSPEQAKGQKLDARSDIFSLGTVLYEMVHGRFAFPGATTAEVFAALLGPETVSPGPVTATSTGSSLGQIISKALQKDPEKRYGSIDDLAQALKAVALNRHTAIVAASGKKHQRISRLAWRSAAILLALLFVVAAAHYGPWRQLPLLSDRDTILLTDFTNQTGDPVFDVTLKQGLAVQLEQSPHLDVFPEDRVRSRLQFMRRSPDEPVTEAIGREICQREGLKALVMGVIASLGNHYAITLTAIDSTNGNILAQSQAEAPGKERVLRALSQAATALRGKLGESVRSLEKFDAMLDVTTPSLEALRAYSLGGRERERGNAVESIAFYRRATELDPDFAAAYLGLAISYHNTRQHRLAAEAGTKAYALREHASELERLRILSEYHSTVTGDSEKRIEILKVQSQLFPRTIPDSNLAAAYNSIGRFEDGLEQSRAAVQKGPSYATRWAVLGVTLIRVGRFSEAADVYRQALDRHLDTTSFHRGLFWIAFVNGDQASMAKQVAWAERRRLEENALDWQGSAAAALGQRRRSELLARRLEELPHATEAAAGLIAQTALRSAALGYCGTVKERVFKALALQHDVVSLSRGTLAMAWCGKTREAEALNAQLAREYLQNSSVHGIWLRAIRAAILIKAGHAQSAIDALEAARYEAAGEFWPQYLRGQAFLQVGQPDQAAAEFRKILDHRGQDPITPLYPLAKLGAARAARLKHDAAQAQSMYAEFLADWKNADPGLPALAEAHEAMAKIESRGSSFYGSAVR